VMQPSLLQAQICLPMNPGCTPGHHNSCCYLQHPQGMTTAAYTQCKYQHGLLMKAPTQALLHHNLGIKGTA
jgi:hypothetical protein